MKVRAIQRGQYKGIIRERGEVFEIEDDKHDGFLLMHKTSHLEHWMEKIEEE